MFCKAYLEGGKANPNPNPNPNPKAYLEGGKVSSADVLFWRALNTAKRSKGNLREKVEALGGVARSAVRLGKKEEGIRLGTEAVRMATEMRCSRSISARAWLALGEV